MIENSVYLAGPYPPTEPGEPHCAFDINKTCDGCGECDAPDDWMTKDGIDGWREKK